MNALRQAVSQQLDFFSDKLDEILWIVGLEYGQFKLVVSGSGLDHGKV